MILRKHAIFPVLIASLAIAPMASAMTTMTVQSGRIRVLKEGSRGFEGQFGPVVYWMFRDQRVSDNWALIHAVHQANNANVPVAVVFNLFDQFLGAKARHLGFMLRSLRQLSQDIQQNLQIPFFLVRVIFDPVLLLCKVFL